MIGKYDIEHQLAGAPAFDTSHFATLEIITVLDETRQADFPVIWEVGVGGSIGTSPVLNGKTIYFGDCDKKFYALDLESRQVVWSFPTNGPVLSSPTLHEDILYFGSFDWNLYAVGLDGKLRWKFSTRGKIFSKPAVHAGVVYFGSQDGNLYAVTEKEGRLLWSFKTKGPVHSSPLVHKGRIFFGSFDHNFYCLSMEGRLLWSFKTNGVPVAFTFPAEGDTVYFSSWEGKLRAVSLEGRERWAFSMNAPINTSVILHDGILYFGSRNHRFYAVSTTGRLVWVHKTKEMCGESGTVHDGVLYMGAGDSNIYALEAKTGRVLWTYKSDGAFAHSLPVIAGNALYIGNWNCRLYAVGLDGRLLWTFQTSLSRPSPVELQASQIRAISQAVVFEDEVREKEDRYKSRPTGEPGSSQYVVKSDYIMEHKYTKSRKIKSMSSGWGD